MLKKLNSFKLISIFFAIITIFFTGYTLVNPDDMGKSLNYTQLFLGCMFLFSSLSDFKENPKRNGFYKFISFVINILCFHLDSNGQLVTKKYVNSL
ncbi:hypothetical protein PMSD_08320 [Paenibacillus macquariensis subsp. defensor]|nr:hypothetical protein PMSD_08320 [Paenibacillus macquariensis subsp. defensor]